MRRLLLLLCLVLMTPACPEDLPSGDAGDAAWAQRATLYLLGRRVLDLDELDVIVGAVGTYGRAEVARRMAGTEEARERWGLFLYDHLFVNRVDARSNPECYGDARMEPSRALAEHVATNPPSVPFGEDWGMADLRASALMADRLGPLFRANLFYSLPDGVTPLNLIEGQSFRRDLGEIFTATYLGRNLVCMPCHNSEYSVTGSDNPESDRTWELPGYVEKALFGFSDGRDPEDLHTLFRRRGVVRGFYFAQETPPAEDGVLLLYGGCGPIDGFAGCAGCACEEAVCGEYPECCDDEWTVDCAAACADAEPDGCEREVPADFDGCIPVVGAQGGGCGGCDCEAAVCEVDSFCCDGQWDEFCAGMCRSEGGCELASDGVQPWGPSSGCAEFVDPAVVEDDLSGHVGWFGGELGADGSVWDIDALLAEGIESMSGRAMTESGDVPAADAFAWLMALKLGNAVWEEAFGAPLTVPHGFPRNQAQRDRLMTLGSAVTLSGFGLREVLVAVTTDPLFNQAAPIESDALPYGLDPVVDPFSIESQVEEQRGNGIGDVVHRLPPRVQLRALERAMGWPATDEFGTWPEEGRALLLERIGAFMKDTAPGFDGVGFQSLLAWEDGVGKCRMEGVEEDYISALLKLAVDEGEEWRAVLSAIKERLVSDPIVTDAELAAAEGFLGIGLSGEVGAGDEAERAARDWCGALLSSPQFLLTGLPPTVPIERDGLRVDGATAAAHAERWGEVF